MYEIEFPAYLEGYEVETESKGYLVDLIVRNEGKEWNVTVYDPARLAQEISDELENASCFAVSNLLVVPVVTKDAIRAALAESGAACFE